MIGTNQQIHSEGKAVEMNRPSPNYWLRLLGDTDQVVQSANGRNGNRPQVQVAADRPEMADYPPELWLRLLSGASLAGGPANNGRSPKLRPDVSHPQDQQFTSKFWLRLLGDTR